MNATCQNESTVRDEQVSVLGYPSVTVSTGGALMVCLSNSVSL